MDDTMKNPTLSVEHCERDMNETLYPRGVNLARVIQVIETVVIRGSGKKEVTP